LGVHPLPRRKTSIQTSFFIDLEAFFLFYLEDGLLPLGTVFPETESMTSPFFPQLPPLPPPSSLPLRAPISRFSSFAHQFPFFATPCFFSTSSVSSVCAPGHAPRPRAQPFFPFLFLLFDEEVCQPDLPFVSDQGGLPENLAPAPSFVLWPYFLTMPFRACCPSPPHT